MHRRHTIAGKTFNKSVKSFLLAKPKPQSAIREEQKGGTRAAMDIADETIADEKIPIDSEWTLVEQMGDGDEFNIKTVWADEADEKVLFELRDSIVQSYLSKSK